jgi:hypothetical protein
MRKRYLYRELRILSSPSPLPVRIFAIEVVVVVVVVVIVAIIGVLGRSRQASPILALPGA